MSALYPPVFRGLGPGLVPRVSAQSGRVLLDDGSWVSFPLNFLGSVAGGSVPAADSVNAGDAYYVSSTGGSYTEGDWIVSNGTAWSVVDFTSLAPLASTTVPGRIEIATQAEGDAGTAADRAVPPTVLHGFALPRFAARRARGQVWSDGATTHRRQSTDSNTRNDLTGASKGGFWALVTVPDTTPTADTYLFGLASAGTPPAASLANSLFGVILSGTDNLLIRANGASAVNDRIFLSLTNFRTTYSGLTGLLTGDFENGSDDPVWKWNGTNISSPFTGGSAGTAPVWLDPALDDTRHLIGYNWPRGLAPIGGWINAHPSAADITHFLTYGQWPFWIANGGSQVALFTSNFGTDLTGFTADAGITLDTGNSEVDFATGGAAYLRGTSLLGATLGLVTEVTFTIANYSSGTLRVADSSGNAFTLRDGATNAFTANGTYTVSFLNDRSLSAVLFGAGSALTLSLKAISTRRLGALSLPVPIQDANIIADGTAIGGNPATLTGMTVVGGDKGSTVGTVTSTSYTMLKTDRARVIRFNNASPGTFTISSAVAWDIGDVLIIEQMGAGAATFAGSGVTLNTESGYDPETRAQYTMIAATCVAANTFTVTGALATA